MYNFLFDRQSMVLLLAGTVTAAGLIFFGGLLVGLQWGLPPELFAAAPSPAPAARVAAAQPCEPAAPAVEPAPLARPRVAAEQFASLQAAPDESYAEPIPEPVPGPEPQPEPATPPVIEQEEEGRYSLQVGAFRDVGNSEKVIQDLRSRGYEPYVIEEGSRRVLRTVRIGRYAERQEALRAASEFEQREGMDAIVRPL